MGDLPLRTSATPAVCVGLGALHPTPAGVATLGSLVCPSVNAEFSESVNVRSAQQVAPLAVSGLEYYPGDEVSVAMNSAMLGTFTAVRVGLQLTANGILLAVTRKRQSATSTA